MARFWRRGRQMQGSKLPGKTPRFWIAGVSTALILVGCEAEPLNEQAANTNQPAKTAELKKKEVDARASGDLYQNGASTIEFEAQGAPAASPAAAQGVSDYLQSTMMPFIPGVGETYIASDESPIKQVAEAPVSTFSIDVDTGAY